MSSNIPEVGQIAITVIDVSKSLTFYRDILGLEFLLALILTYHFCLPEPFESCYLLHKEPGRLVLTSFSILEFPILNKHIGLYLKVQKHIFHVIIVFLEDSKHSPPTTDEFRQWLSNKVDGFIKKNMKEINEQV